MNFPITLETTSDEIIKQISIPFDLTIEKIYKKLLQKKEIERNKSEVFYVANPNPNIEENKIKLVVLLIGRFGVCANVKAKIIRTMLLKEFS